jgi:hypothetical protein
LEGAVVLVAVFMLAAVALLVWSGYSLYLLERNKKIPLDFIELWYNDEAPWDCSSRSALDIVCAPMYPTQWSLQNIVVDPATFMEVVRWHGIDDVTPALQRAFLKMRSIHGNMFDPMRDGVDTGERKLRVFVDAAKRNTQ